MNFIDSLKKRVTNFTETENGATAHKSTLKKVYDMFALGGAYRQRTDEDCILTYLKMLLQEDEDSCHEMFILFEEMYGEEDKERRFFRVCFNWLAKNYPEIAKEIW